MKAYIAFLTGDPRSAERILHLLMREFCCDIEITSLYCKCLAALGRADEALRILESFDFDEDEDEALYEKAHAQLIRAEVCRALGQANEAEMAAQRAMELLRSRDDAHLIPESKVCLALAERDLGNEQRAQRLLSEGVELYLRKGNVVMVGRTRDLLLGSG